MKEYAFDVDLCMIARVTASSEEEARAKLHYYADCIDIGMVTDDGVAFTEASAKGEVHLFEIEGEAV